MVRGSFSALFFLKASLLSNSKADGTQLPIYKTGRKCHPTSRLPHQVDACVGSIKSLFPHLRHPPIWTLWRRGGLALLEKRPKKVRNKTSMSHESNNCHRNVTIKGLPTLSWGTDSNRSYPSIDPGGQSIGVHGRTRNKKQTTCMLPTLRLNWVFFLF